MLQIRESDWKLLRVLHPTALDRFCERVLEEIERASRDASKIPHERYLEVYSIIESRDKELAACFDDLARSRGIERVAAYRARGLLTDEEFTRFSQETRNMVEILLGR